jgi:hypothetical protein
MAKKSTPRKAVKTRKINKNGCVLYDGPSLWDGKRIVVILTGLMTSSANSKTGKMLQTWILRADAKPTVARKRGSDESVCGDCPHRAGSCYVNLGQGPRAVWECWNRGGYADYDGAIHNPRIIGRKLRIGSYGDPAMVPVATFATILSLSSGHTGYTHQWDKPLGADLRMVCMASCDTEKQAQAAQSAGWRTFNVTADTTGIDGSVMCPASKEAGVKTDCANCNLCKGGASKAKSVFIVVHGTIAHIAQYRTKTAPAIAKRETVSA